MARRGGEGREGRGG